MEYLTISTNVSYYKKSTTILFAFQQHSSTFMHASAHGVRNTVQQLLRKTFNFISPELWLQQTRA